MYLTKLVFNIKDKYVLRNMANCNWVHHFILENGFGSIEGKDIRKTLNILYNMEGNIVLVQSFAKPNFTCKPNVLLDTPKTIEIDKMQELFINGNLLHYECICNPTKRTREGKRVFLTSQQERTDWFKRTMEKCGADILVETQGPEKTVWGVKKEGDKSHRIYAKSVKFSGSLRVIDCEKLWQAFCNGIGREKSYGCGMLLITK